MHTEYHVMAILLGIGLVLLNDLIGALWMVGLVKRFSERFLIWIHRLISAAFMGAVGTGVAMAISKPEVIQPFGFWIKMAFVALIAVNGYFMGGKCRALAGHRFKEISTLTKLGIMVGVGVSLFLWLGTAVVGLFGMRFTL